MKAHLASIFSTEKTWMNRRPKSEASAFSKPCADTTPTSEPEQVVPTRIVPFTDPILMRKFPSSPNP
eukprot:12404166-Karenia_brevis.AAC.1